ncbi:two-component regulator propeller domain-containing protein [Niabella hibiscisoli]|uniref:two-component regulator propeller domain-containing protein n=1 Tax=Niabella hibiscisoli TaxID=1825928 RepID=UPI00374CCB85
MWLATPYGLNRYDGRRFLTYLRNKEPNSISDNYILSLFTDKSGQLWAGTTNGLNRYNEFKDGFDTLFQNCLVQMLPVRSMSFFKLVTTGCL